MGEKVEELCRLCAGFDPVRLPIFSTEGRQRNLYGKIQTCLRFKVSEEDGYPSSVCYTCMFNLENCYTFYESCQKAQTLLQTKIVTENHSTNDLARIKLEPGKADAIRPFPCDLCPTSFMSAQERWVHVSQNHKGDSRITCIFCRKGFSTVSNLNFHKKNKHPMELEELERSKLKPLPPLTKINNEPVPIAQPHLLIQQQLQQTHPIPLPQLQPSQQIPLPQLQPQPQPKLNNKAFDAVQNFLNHKPDLANFNLKIGNTDIKFGNTNIKIGNTDISIGNRPDTNNKSMIDRLKNLGVEVSTGNLKQQQYPHNDIEARRKELIKLQQQHQKDFQGPEDLLELDLLDPADNLESMIESESVYGCEVCYRDFKDRSSLWLHMLYSHKNESGYTCGICLKLCPTYQQLSEHVMHCKELTESEKRRYYCIICLRQHESRKKLESHVLIHNLNDEFIRDNYDLNNLVASNPQAVPKYDDLQEAEAASEFSDSYSQEMDATNDSTQNSYFQGMYDENQSYKDNLAYQSFLEGSGHFLESSSFFDNVKTEEEKKSEDNQSESNQFRCDECFKTYETSLQLTKHKYNVHKNPSRLLYRNDSFGNPIYECEYCGQTYDSPKQLTKHRYNVHKYQAIVSSGVDELGRPVFGCSECPRVFETPRQLQKHKYNVHKMMGGKKIGCDSPSSVESAKPSFQYSSFNCEICSDKLGSKTERWKHCFVKHKDEQKLRCMEEGCGKVMPTEAFKNEHLTFHTQQGASPICCEICAKLFTSKLEFWKHVSGVHFSLIGLTCGVCTKMFLTLEDLKEHIKRHEPLSEAEFNCDICGRGYSSKPKMARHRLVHENDPDNDEYNILKHTLLQGNRAQIDKKYEILNIPKVNRQFSDNMDMIDVNPDDSSSFIDNDENGSDNLWCDVCPDMTFNDLDELRTHRRNIHALYPCDLCSKFYGGVSHLWKHANRCHKGHPDITCSVCNKTSASRIQLRGHINKNHRERLMGHVTDGSSLPLDMLPDPDPTNLNCQRCGREFKIRSLVRRHEKTCLTKVFDPDPTNLNCSGCGKYFAIRSQVRRHEKTCCKLEDNADPESLKCKICSKEFPSVKNCRRHERSCGGKDDIEQNCEFCGKFFTNRKAFIHHVDYNHSIIHCDICTDSEEFKEEKNAFRSKAELYTHCKEKHADHPELLCSNDKCKRLMRTKLDLEKHMREHKNRENPPTCEFCADIFKGRKKLRIHILHNHKNEALRKFVCGICVKVHESNEELIDHCYKEHSKLMERDYTCKMCGRQYNTISKVLDHHKTSHDEQYKPCRICLSIFTEDDKLNEHLKEHAAKGDRLVSSTPAGADVPTSQQCMVCLEVFEEVTALYEHTKKEHPNLPDYSCPVCGRKYMSVYTAHDHLESKHGKVYIGCRKCLAVFTNLEDKTKHMDIHGINEPDPLNCSLCSKHQESEELLEQHLKDKHAEYFEEGAERYLCLICSKQLKYKNSIYLHVEKNHPNNFCCRSCLMIYKDKELLREHQERMHTKDKTPSLPYNNSFNFMKKAASQSIKRVKNQCYVCHNVEGDTKSLYRHVLKEHPEIETQTDTCFICGQKYSSRHKVHHHVITYHGFPYTCCKKCLKIFTCEEDLLAHQETDHQDTNKSDSFNNKRKRKTPENNTPKRIKSRHMSSTENESLISDDTNYENSINYSNEDENLTEDEDDEEFSENNIEKRIKIEEDDYVCELGKNEKFKIKIKHNVKKEDGDFKGNCAEYERPMEDVNNVLHNIKT